MKSAENRYSANTDAAFEFSLNLSRYKLELSRGSLSCCVKRNDAFNLQSPLRGIEPRFFIIFLKKFNASLSWHQFFRHRLIVPL